MPIFRLDMGQFNWKQRNGFTRTVKAALAGLLVFQLFLLLALGGSPALHHALHSDSNQADHSCLVTVFTKGQLSEAVAVPILCVPGIFILCTVLLPDRQPQSFFAYRFDASRAPPVR